MGDTMLHGVLNMPTDAWSNDPLDQAQRHCRYVEASKRIKRQDHQITIMREALQQIRMQRKGSIPDHLREIAANALDKAQSVNG